MLGLKKRVTAHGGSCLGELNNVLYTMRTTPKQNRGNTLHPRTRVRSSHPNRDRCCLMWNQAHQWNCEQCGMKYKFGSNEQKTLGIRKNTRMYEARHCTLLQSPRLHSSIRGGEDGIKTGGNHKVGTKNKLWRNGTGRTRSSRSLYQVQIILENFEGVKLPCHFNVDHLKKLCIT